MDRPRLLGVALASLGVAALCALSRKRRKRSQDLSSAIAVVGDSFCDIVCRLERDDLPQWGEDRLAEAVDMVAGGSALNTAIWLKYCDPSTRVSIVRTFGQQDFAGKVLMERLEQSGVKVAPLKGIDRYDSGVCVCLSGRKDRAFVSKRGTLGTMTCANIDIDSLFKGVPTGTPRHLHLAGYYNCKGLWPDVTDLVRRAKNDGCSVSLSPQFDATGGWDGGVGDILGGIDVIICNKDEARHIAATLSTLKGDSEPTLLALARQQSVDPAAEEYAAHILYHGLACGNQGLKVVVTLADKGALLSSARGVTYCPAVETDCVDACGAGDAFTAAFLSSWMRNEDDEESALREGCRAGGKCFLNGEEKK